MSIAVQPVSKQQHGFMYDAASAAMLRAARDHVISPLDRYVPVSPDVQRFLQRAGRALNPFSQGVFRYEQVFGLDYQHIDIGPDNPFRSYRQIFATKAGRAEIVEAVRDNFKGAHLPRGFSFKNTVMADNIDRISGPMQAGKAFTSFARVGMIGTSLLTVGKRTREEYKNSGSLLKSAVVFAKEAVKSLISWEIGSLGYLVGFAAVPVGALAPVAGIAGMAIASTLAHRALDQVA